MGRKNNFFFVLGQQEEKQLENSSETVGIQRSLNHSTESIQPGGLEKLNNGNQRDIIIRVCESFVFPSLLVLLNERIDRLNLLREL